MNTQKVEKNSYDKDGYLDVVDVYPTIQGEGPFCGYGATFVRLAGCNLQCPLCFHERTFVHVDGSPRTKRIPEIEVGDIVMSYNVLTKSFVNQPVTGTGSREVDEIYYLKTKKDKPTFVTGEHPFLTLYSGWVKAKNLKPGEKVHHLSSPATGMSVEEVAKIVRGTKRWSKLTGRASEPLRVYNLEVAETHTYIADRMIVHNCDTDYTSSRKVMSPRDLLHLCQKFRNKLVVFTGGEPFRQNLTPVSILLIQAMKTIQIETNGTIYDQNYPYKLATIVCSPKGPAHKKLLEKVDSFKYVLRAGFVDPNDGLPTHALGMQARPSRPLNNFKGDIYVQPVDEGDAEKNTANQSAALEACIKHGYRFCIQLHKVLGLP